MTSPPRVKPEENAKREKNMKSIPISSIDMYNNDVGKESAINL